LGQFFAAKFGKFYWGYLSNFGRESKNIAFEVARGYSQNGEGRLAWFLSNS
jgi:hypothetical protein